MAATITTIGEYPAYQVLVRGTTAEILASAPDRYGALLPIGVSTDGGMFVYTATGWRLSGPIVLPTIADLPAVGTPGVTYTIVAFPGASLTWAADLAKWEGKLGRLTVANGGLSDANTIAAAVLALPLAPRVLIVVPNPAVPLGWSRMLFNGSVFAPPLDEPIAGFTGTTAVFSVTPGVLAKTEVYVSPVIPDYVIPFGLAIKTGNNIGVHVRNSLGVAGSQVAITVSGSVQDSDFGNALNAATVTPTATGTGVVKSMGVAILTSAGGGFMGPSSGAGFNSTATIKSRQLGTFVSGANRLRVTAIPTHVGDVIEGFQFMVCSAGNL